MTKRQPKVRTEVIGDAVLYMGNCLDILPTLDKTNAVVTDPPYGTQDLVGGYNRKGDTILNDHDLSALESVFPLLCKAVPIGWLLIFHASRVLPEFIRITASAPWHGSFVWVKAAHGLGYGPIRYSHEDVAVFRLGDPPKPRPEFSVLRSPTIAEDHPHQKPVDVLRKLVRWSVGKHGTVLDPFMGSGSTGVAALEISRKFIGIELDQKYFDIARRRIEKAWRQPKLDMDRVKPKKAGLEL